ncbi:serine/threonine protein kinase, partial [Frankia sp. CNm7]|uniref:serine/threonine-protein kinase n=1 Tax=Frankia nepalensis TaxID=1836974 RepID=UPI00193408D2
MGQLPPGVEPLDEHDPDVLGPYQVLGRLGDGGMGSVYLARHGGTGPFVAIKVIRPDLARIDQFRERFQREASAAQRVARSATAAVIDVNTTGSRPYLVTEYIEGPTLEARIHTRGPLSVSELEWLATAVATALRAIHAAGVVHRDLKPSNILLSPFGARVIDFGISRALDATTMFTEGTIGTPSFMAPEQAMGQTVTEAADIHAWGAVLAYAAAGRPPFSGDSLPGVMLNVATAPPDLSGLPAALHPLVVRAMAKDAAERPTAAELLGLLHHAGTLVAPAAGGPGSAPAEFPAGSSIRSPALPSSSEDLGPTPHSLDNATVAFEPPPAATPLPASSSPTPAATGTGPAAAAHSAAPSSSEPARPTLVLRRPRRRRRTAAIAAALAVAARAAGTAARRGRSPGGAGVARGCAPCPR